MVISVSTKYASAGQADRRHGLNTTKELKEQSTQPSNDELNTGNTTAAAGGCDGGVVIA